MNIIYTRQKYDKPFCANIIKSDLSDYPEKRNLCVNQILLNDCPSCIDLKVGVDSTPKRITKLGIEV